MSSAVFFSRTDLDTGTMAEPSIVKLVVSERGSSKFSGRRSASSINLFWRILATNFGGIGARPGPKLKAFSGPSWELQDTLEVGLKEGVGTSLPRLVAFRDGWVAGKDELVSGTLPLKAVIKEGACNIPCCSIDELPEFDVAMDVEGSASPNCSNCVVERGVDVKLASAVRSPERNSGD